MTGWSDKRLKTAWDLICEVEEDASNEGSNDAWPMLYNAARLIEKADDELKGVEL